MALTSPPAAPDAPPAIPARADDETFDDRADSAWSWLFAPFWAFISAFRVWYSTAAKPELEALQADVTAKQIAAAASNVAAAVNAAAAAASAGATVWVSGTNYTQWSVRYSPTNGQTYRDSVGGVSSTDPAADTTGRWISAMLPQAELPNLPPTAVFNFASGVIDRRFTEQRTTARTRVGKFGVGQAVAAGVAVADYDVVTRACRGYLAEPAATYVAINSEDFSGWGAADTGGGFGAAVAAPDGTLTAKTWTHSNSTGNFAYGAATKSGVDASGQAVFEIWMRRPAGSGAIGLFISDVNVISNSAARAVDETWRKLTFTSTTLTNTGNIGIGFSGNIGEVFEFWHPTLTLGTTAGRSYEPTVGSNVTTTAGGLVMDLTAHTEIINPRGFTFVVAFERPGVSAASKMIVCLTDGTAGSYTALYINNNDLIADAVVSSVSLGGTDQPVAVQAGERCVVAVSFGDGQVRFAQKAGSVASVSLTSMPTLTSLIVGRYTSAGLEPNAPIELLATFPRACTAGELTAFVNNF